MGSGKGTFHPLCFIIHMIQSPIISSKSTSISEYKNGGHVSLLNSSAVEHYYRHSLQLVYTLQYSLPPELYLAHNIKSDQAGHLVILKFLI